MPMVDDGRFADLNLIESKLMTRYKGHPIYGIAVPTPQHSWSSRGLVFDKDQNQTVELKRIECPAELTFKRKQLAEDHGLALCRGWIDEQPAEQI
jgi:hypothetical protein